MSPIYRSLLYLPASKDRALDKARSLAADALIFDLEDAVAPDEKPRARKLLAEVLASADFGPRQRLVRVNGRDTSWGAEDLAAFASHPGVDALLIPKVDQPGDLDFFARLAPDKTAVGDDGNRRRHAECGGDCGASGADGDGDRHQ